MESGASPITVIDARALLSLYGMADPLVVDAACADARTAGTVSWWHDHLEVIGLDRINYLEIEESARRLRVYEYRYVPDLLQTISYARAISAVLHNPLIPAGTTAGSVMMDRRRRLLDSENREFEFLLSEAALRHSTGSSFTHQLARLIALSRRPHISIRIIPFSAGAFPSVARELTARTIIDLPGVRDPVVFTCAGEGTPSHSTSMTSAESVQLFRDDAACALNDEESRTLLEANLALITTGRQVQDLP